MGLDLTWKEEDRKRFGKCGKDLDTIVGFVLPRSTDARYRECGAHYIINDKKGSFSSWRDQLKEIEGIPEGGEGYAIEYVRFEKILSKDDIKERIRKSFSRGLKGRSKKEKEEFIEKEAESFVRSSEPGGHNFAGGMASHKGLATTSAYKFVRWVSKDEFVEKAKYAKENSDEEDTWVWDRWSFGLTYKQHDAKCRKCPLSTKIKGSNTEGCYKGSTYSHWGTFMDFINKYGNFEVLDHEHMNSDGGVKIEELDKLEEEVKKAREILESVELPGIKVYDISGKLLRTVPGGTRQLYGNSSWGYGVGIEDDNGIMVVSGDHGIFGLPVEARKEIMKEGGLDGLMAVSAELREQRPRSYFQEIFRSKDTYFGRTKEGMLVELPPIKFPKGKGERTPFDGYGGFERNGGEKIGRLEFTKVKALEGFGYLVELLEKYVTVAKKFNIPIEGC